MARDVPRLSEIPHFYHSTQDILNEFERRGPAAVDGGLVNAGAARHCRERHSCEALLCEEFERRTPDRFADSGAAPTGALAGLRRP